MKYLALVIALCILAFGVAGVVDPANMVWVAQHAVSSGVFYVVAVIRIAFGLLLISVAPTSRAPRALRVLGYVLVLAGIGAALVGLLAIDSARAIIDWWIQQGSGLIRLTSLVLIVFSGFIAWACVPFGVRRAA